MRLRATKTTRRSSEPAARLEEVMSENQVLSPGRLVRRPHVVSTLFVLIATFICVDPVFAQLFQWTPEQLAKYTSKNPYDRFPDGRPKVPDEMLERLKGLIAEEVQAVLPSRGYPNQFESRDGWRVLQPNQKMVGRVLTIQFMPLRGDIAEVDEAEAKAKGTSVARNQTAIDMLQPGDVIVADVFGADWNFVGNKLAHYIQTTTKNGMIVDGGVYWLERIAETGMQAYYKNSLPSQGMRVMVTGINIPVRIGKTLVMPGDVVLADREGMWFIPPHMVKEVVESGELSKARDDWSLMMLGTGKYTSRQIYGPLTPELQKERDEYVFKKTGRRPPQQRDQ
jgi:4-hydroxy-4-methyl-2-oxoglutarate aldolase